MDTQNKKFLYTISAVILFVLLALSLTDKVKSRSLFGVLFQSEKVKKFQTRTDFIKVPESRYKVIHHDNSQQPVEKIYTNDYQPSNTYAETYVEPEDVKHPLVASTKFISKKDKLKKAKKRKKDLSKKSKKGSSPTIEDEDDFSDDEETASHQTSAALGGMINAAAPAAKKKSKEEEEKELNTVEYWETPIFVEEDFKAVIRLIESYQIRKVSNNVFYTVVDDMTHDERSSLREFGVIALTATPSAKSFTELAWMKHNDTITDIRTSAGKELKNYIDANRVNHVVGVLRTDSETNRATIEALAAISATTRKYSSVSSEQEGGPQTVSRTDLTKLQPRLDSARQIIEEKYIHSSDPKIKSEANKTVAAIDSFVAR